MALYSLILVKKYSHFLLDIVDSLGDILPRLLQVLPDEYWTNQLVYHILLINQVQFLTNVEEVRHIHLFHHCTRIYWSVSNASNPILQMGWLTTTLNSPENKLLYFMNLNMYRVQYITQYTIYFYSFQTLKLSCSLFLLLLCIYKVVHIIYCASHLFHHFVFVELAIELRP